jgi:long-chain fatty acid transport protein
MFKIFQISILAGIISGAFLCTQSFAAGSGAFRLEVPDAGAAGKGSAFVGEANTPAAVYYNPAGMTQLDQAAVSVGFSVIQPFVNYESNAGEESQMRRGTYVIPEVFFVQPVGERFAVGFGALSSWGLTTYWHQDSFARYNATKSVLENKDYLISTAYKLNDQFTFAVSLDIDDSSVDKQKKISQGAGLDGNFRLKGDSTRAGYRIAGMYRLNERHQFGLIYRSAVEHKYTGKVYLSELNYSPVATLGGASYADIFGTSFETDVVSKTTLPDSVVLGYSFQPTPKWVFNADLEWMNWSVVNEEELAYPGLDELVAPHPLAGFRGLVLNGGNPASRDWMSMLSFAVGTQYNVSEKFRWRTGYYYRQSPIPGDTWEANLPDSDSHGVTLGVGYDLTKSLTLDLAWSGIYYNTREVDNTAAGGTINGTYRQTCNLLYATATYKF